MGLERRRIVQVALDEVLLERNGAVISHLMLASFRGGMLTDLHVGNSVHYVRRETKNVKWRACRRSGSCLFVPGVRVRLCFITTALNNQNSSPQITQSLLMRYTLFVA
ncbi:hypothetical protein RvY_19159 [Ramazzottius varieornatus]|uniref:Uncharacterized protein n=1 Tax=Ramazzottius varieornatus TaxID=947166 RepID=A0A1D1W8G4_RAMVA|nr:hypothetical protein RvY_19159 [Ramazzottius varieornatus]